MERYVRVQLTNWEFGPHGFTFDFQLGSTGKVPILHTFANSATSKRVSEGDPVEMCFSLIHVSG